MKQLRARPRWIAAGLATLAVVLALVLVVTSASGGEGPPTGAAQIVPADALAYVHLSTASSSSALQQADSLLGRFPDHAKLTAAVTGRLTAILGGGVPLDFERQVRPWLGAEAAFAVLNTPGASASTLIILDVTRAGRLFSSGAVAAGSYRGVKLYRNPAGTELAFVGHYLAVGQAASLRSAIDVSEGQAPSLAHSAAFRAASAGEPSDRVLDAYVSAAGVRRLLAPRGGLVGAAALLLSQAGLRGTAFSLAPASGGFTVVVHSALEHGQARPPSFTPTLAGSLPSGSALMLDVADLARAAPTVLGATAQLGIVSQLGPLLSQLGGALRAEGVAVKNILSIFGGESAVEVTPVAGTPALVLVARTRTQSATATALAALEAPLAQLFSADAGSSGQEPEFNDRQIGSITAHQLALAPGFQLDYAIFKGLVVMSTSLTAIAEVASHPKSLAADPNYQATLAHRPSSVTSLLFLDFSQLLNLGEQTGLIHGSSLSGLSPDLSQIRAIGSSSTSGEADTTAELFLKIS